MELSERDLRMAAAALRIAATAGACLVWRDTMHRLFGWWMP